MLPSVYLYVLPVTKVLYRVLKCRATKQKLLSTYTVHNKTLAGHSTLPTSTSLQLLTLYWFGHAEILKYRLTARKFIHHYARSVTEWCTDWRPVICKKLTETTGWIVIKSLYWHYNKTVSVVIMWRTFIANLQFQVTPLLGTLKPYFQLEPMKVSTLK